MKKICIALTKGRVEKQTIELLEEVGFSCRSLKEKNRQLIFDDMDSPFRFILVKAVDVLTYVKHGVADLGIVGSDVLEESNSRYNELLDLQIGRCKMAVASCADYDPLDYRKKRIATKYPVIAAKFFREKGEDIDLIKIEGSVEIAPPLGLADAIVDIVETGTTLRENGLFVIEDIQQISTRLIANSAALRRQTNEIFDFVDRIDAYLQKG